MSEPDNLPAVRVEPPTAVVVRRDTDSWADQLPAIVELARSICGTDFVPEAMRDNVAATAAAILYGREVSLPPMTALSNVNVIKGRPGLSAVIMRAQVLAAGHEIRQDASDSSRCVLSGRRRGTDYWQTVTYTIDDARQAGLIKRGKNGEPSMYEKNPRRMLRARATSELCELMFADVVRGMPSLEELEEQDDDTPAGPPAKATRATVQRKGRSKTDDGAASGAANPTAGAGAPAAPSSPPLPPLPGEPGFDGPDVGVAAAAQSADGETRVPATPASTPKSPALAGEVATSTTRPGNASGPGPADVPDPGSGSAVSDRRVSGRSVEDPPGQASQTVREEHCGNPNPHEQHIDDSFLGTGGRVLCPGTALTPAQEPEVEREERPRMITRAMQKGMFATFNTLGITDDSERLHITEAIIGRTPMHAGKPSSNGLTAAEAQLLIDALARCKSRDHVEALVQLAVQERAAEDGGQA